MAGNAASGERPLSGGVSPGVWVGSILTGVIAAAVILRIPSMGDSIYMDELSTYFVIGYDFAGMISQVESPQEWTPPLYFILAWISSKLGPDPWLLRLPSLLAGVLTVPLTYVLGVLTVGRRPALLGSALVALSPLMIAFSTEARAYALMGLLVLCSTIALLLALRRPSPGWWLLYSICLAAAMYTHYSALFVLAGQTIWALVSFPHARRSIALSTLLAALLWLPWLGGYLDDAGNPSVDVIGYLHPFSPYAAGQDLLQAVLGSGSLPARPPNLPGPVPVVLFAVGITIAISSLVASGASGLRRIGKFGALVVVLAVSAPVGAAVSSLLGPDTFLPRTLLPSFPGFSLMLGMLVFMCRRPLALAATACLLVASLWASVVSLSPSNRRADMGRVLTFVDRYGSDRDPIVDCSAPSGASPWQALDLELGPGTARSEKQPVLRLCMPSFRDSYEVRRLGGPGQFALDWNGSIPRPGDVAERAVRAAIDDRIFVIVMGENHRSPSPTPAFGSFGRFLRTLPDGYRIAHTQVQRSIGGLGPTVYEIVLPRDSR